jgi:hypothetical protein
MDCYIGTCILIGDQSEAGGGDVVKPYISSVSEDPRTKKEVGISHETVWW